MENIELDRCNLWYWWNWLSISTFMDTKNDYLVKLSKVWRITSCNGRDPCVILAGALISKCVRSNEHSGSLFFVPTHQHEIVHAPSLNIYWRQFEFHPQLSTIPFLFLLYLQIVEINVVVIDSPRRDLFTADVNYADLDDSANQDDFLLAYPLHRHLFSWLTHPVLSAFLLIAMGNWRSERVNITTLPSEILETMATNVVKTSPTPLDDIVSLRHS
jgi:hypothetical protein